MKKHLFYWLALVFIAVTGCQKELSFELGNTPAEGSLQSDATGDCLPKSVNGVYVAGTPLVPATNTISVSVNVTRTGIYTITTDTINGYHFRGTGTFTALGANSIILRSNGTPFVGGIDNFIVSFDSTICDIAVTVSSPGVGTLAGAPSACAPITVSGGYSPGVALTATNNAVVQLNVTTAGSFNITTDTVAGIWFAFSGTLASGPQNVTLQAQGSIPAATVAGAKTFTVKSGASQCTFIVNVASPAVGTVNCTGSVFAGSFMAGVTMTATNTVQISVTITTPGAYSITTDTVNGVWFNASGIFLTATTTTLLLTANGTPAISGPFTYTVKFGASTCTFVCTVAPPLSNDYFPRTTGSNWSYEFDDDLNDTLQRNVIAATLTVSPNTYNIFMQNDGITPPPDSSGYYRKTSGDYFERFDAGAFIGYDNPTWGEYIMLKDNVAAATNWKTPTAGFAGTVSGTPLKIRSSNTILQKDVPISFTTSTGTMNFINVIVVQEKYEAEVTPGIWQDITTVIDYYGKSYYARGIGLVKFEAYDAGNVITFTQELRRYQVF